MTGEKLLQIIDQYEILLDAYPAKQLERYDAHPVNDAEYLRHCRWMLGPMRERVLQGHIKKAMRWLGFIQGVMAGTRFRTIEQLKNDSRPT